MLAPQIPTDLLAVSSDQRPPHLSAVTRLWRRHQAPPHVRSEAINMISTWAHITAIVCERLCLHRLPLTVLRLQL